MAIGYCGLLIPRDIMIPHIWRHFGDIVRANQLKLPKQKVVNNQNPVAMAVIN